MQEEVQKPIRKQRAGSTYQSMKEFVERTRKLLKEQEQFEINLFNQITHNKTISEIEAAGFGLSNMLIGSTKRGFYGKTVLSLTKFYHSQKSPLLLPQQCKIQVGDDVALFKNNVVIADGVVSKRMGPKLQITTRKELEDDNDLESVVCNVILKWNQVTFRRYYKTLDDMQHSQNGLIPIFFVPASLPVNMASFSDQYANPKLNHEQCEAVYRCMNEKVFLLHGPPGTGKTTTVCQLIVEAVKKGKKVLACGPSNISVDNIVEGLSKRVNCLRIGNPARIIQNVIERCLDYQIANNSNAWKNQVKKLQAAKKRLSKGGTREERKVIYNQIKQLKDQIYKMQELVIQQLLDDAEVICCTNVGAADRVFKMYLPKRVFDLVVIDQCGQALEVSCWIPLLKGRRVVLAGDHKQLPPTIQGNENSLLSYTLFTRAMEQLVHIPSTMLRVQYRMNNVIMGWSNSEFYQDRLMAHSSVEKHTLREICNGVKAEEQTLLFIDTAGCGMGEQGEKDESKMNVGQADLAISIYKKLIGYDVTSKYIAILTPYSKQVALIKTLISQKGLPPLDVSTVDGIQGREKECIIISMVRSNSRREIGFLKDWRRMNVAVTRARRMLVLIGNIECVTVDKHIKALVEWVDHHGHISSAQDFRGNQQVRFGVGASDKIQLFDKKQQAKEQQKSEQQKKKKKRKDKKQKNEDQMQQKNGKEHNQQEQVQVRDHFTKVFQQMAREITINNATAFQRKMIHEAAQNLGLCHETAADKKYIKVWKKMTNDEVAEKYAELQRMKMQQDLKEDKQKQKRKAKMQKRAQNKQARPIHTGDSKKNHMQMLAQQQSSQQQEKIEISQNIQHIEQKTEGVEQIRPKKKKKKNKGKNKQQQAQKVEEEQDIDKIMRQFNADRPKQFQCFKCKKTLTSVTASECKYCLVNFCRMHVLAEEHGCGEAAKIEARRDKPSQKLLEQAAMKLKQKIKEQEQGRKRKGKESKK